MDELINKVQKILDTEALFTIKDKERLKFDVLEYVLSKYNEPTFYLTGSNKNAVTVLNYFGIRSQKVDGEVRVIRVYRNDLEFINEGDTIISIDDLNCSTYHLDKIGSIPSKIKVTLINNYGLLTKVNITRIESVNNDNGVHLRKFDDTDIVDKLLVVDNFNSEHSEYLKKIERIYSSSNKLLIIDLRNNMGGSIFRCNDLIDTLVPTGKIAYYVKTVTDEMSVYKSKDKEKMLFDNIIIIVDRFSASAAEILALALRDSLGAIIVGENTYGKNRIIKTIRLDDTCNLTYPIAMFFSQNMEDINYKGLGPDVLCVADDIEDCLNKLIEEQINKTGD